jgi:hypothetical protein
MKLEVEENLLWEKSLESIWGPPTVLWQSWKVANPQSSPPQKVGAFAHPWSLSAKMANAWSDRLPNARV